MLRTPTPVEDIFCRDNAMLCKKDATGVACRSERVAIAQRPGVFQYVQLFLRVATELQMHAGKIILLISVACLAS